MSESTSSNPPGSPRNLTVSAPLTINVFCDFVNPIRVDPEEANVQKNQQVQFLCNDATLVIVTQFHSRGQKESDHSPFAGNQATLVVPKGTPVSIPVKGNEAMDPNLPDPADPHKKSHGYKYTVVAVSDAGKVSVKDPTIIIR
jgi:hypothetical protein